MTEPIDNLNLSVRTVNNLKRVGIYDLDQLLATDEQTLMRIPGFGTGCLLEVYRIFNTRGLALRVTCPTCGQNLPSRIGEDAE